MRRILVVDDEPQIRHIISLLLKRKGFEVADAHSGQQAVEFASQFSPSVSVLDMKMPGMDGLQTLQALLALDKHMDCIMMTAYGTIPAAVEAIRLGAFDYITKPFDNNDLLGVIIRALEKRNRLEKPDAEPAEPMIDYGFKEIIGKSPSVQAVFRIMAKAAPVDAMILIQGESGTGKELVARAIHRRSLRWRGPFVAVNCGAIPPSLFESEFFGHERGAFTDAKETHLGRFEQAQGGTLFLDEIGELPLDTQVKLLRALQDHEITRLGGRHPIKVDVRVIAATHVNLQEAVARKAFREDLYWRLNVVKILLPNLKERREDIPLLIEHMIARFNKELGLSVKSISAEAFDLLVNYNWPGNVRGLENAICSVMIMCEGDEIQVCDLPANIRGESPKTDFDSPVELPDQLDLNGRSNLAEAVKKHTERIEKAVIVSRLAKMKGNRTATAQSLGMSRKSLFNKMRQYGLTAMDT